MSHDKIDFDIKYRIIEIDQSQHSMIVRYYTDKITEFDLATSYMIDSSGNTVIQTRSDGSPARCQTDYNINIWKTPAPSPEELKEIASAAAPFDWFKLKHNILDPQIDTSLSNVASLLDREFIAIKPEIPDIVGIKTQLTEEELNELQLEKLISDLMLSQNTSSNTSNT